MNRGRIRIIIPGHFVLKAEERIFYWSEILIKYSKSARLICEDDGEEFSLEHGDLEMILNGLDGSNYENTVAIGQMKVEPNQSLAVEITKLCEQIIIRRGNSDIDLEWGIEPTRTKKERSRG